ncbi:MAG: DUF4253 domain-containing protein [Bacteroidota bacterium]|nr:DUF4253 domain-containing protein [Bacteroidota bacterium]
MISEIYALKPTYIRCFDTIIFPMDNPMRRHAFKGMEFYLSEKQAGIWYNKHQLTMLANHYQSYLAGYPDHNMRHKIRVIKSTEPYAALKFEGTNGHNYGITTDSLIKKLEYWNNNTLKMLVVGAQFDYVQLRIIQEPTDWEAFAKEVYAFCPDAVDQNANSDFKSFLSTMEASKSLVLWWD